MKQMEWYENTESTHRQTVSSVQSKAWRLTGRQALATPRLSIALVRALCRAQKSLKYQKMSAGPVESDKSGKRE